MSDTKYYKTVTFSDEELAEVDAALVARIGRLNGYKEDRYLVQARTFIEANIAAAERALKWVRK